MILNDFFEFTDAISCNLLLCFTRALSFWTFAMCRGCPVCFFIVDRPTLPIYIGISKTNTKDIAGQFARIHQWKQTGLPQHLKLWALLFSGWHISFSVMQQAASMAGVLELIFSPAVLVTFQGLIGKFAVFFFVTNLNIAEFTPFAAVAFHWPAALQILCTQVENTRT